MILSKYLPSSTIWRKEYHEVTAASDTESLLDEKSPAKPANISKKHLVVLTLFNIILCVTTIFILVVLISNRKNSSERNADLKKAAFFSPFLDRFDIPVNIVKINGSLANEQDSIFRKSPSPEVDAAWERISQIGYHVITASDVEKLGRDPSTAVHAPLEWGYGADAYLAVPDTFHLLHCLNILRKGMYPDHYSDRRIMKDVHPLHCLSLVMQSLMCDASLDVITYTWRETQIHPFPEMSVNKKCRNFDTVLDWHEKNLVEDPRMKAMRKPDDVESLPLSPLLMKLIAEDDAINAKENEQRADKEDSLLQR